MSVYYNYLAVVGRIHGDDEDTIFFYEGLTIDQARSAFCDDQRDGEAIGDDKIYINYVLTSESPIEMADA